MDYNQCMAELNTKLKKLKDLQSKCQELEKYINDCYTEASLGSKDEYTEALKNVQSKQERIQERIKRTLTNGRKIFNNQML